MAHPTWRSRRVRTRVVGTHFTTHRTQTWLVCPTRASRLPVSLPNPVANHLAGALIGRELRRVGRVSLLCFPSHPPQSPVCPWVWPCLTTAGRHTVPTIATPSWISPADGVAHLLPTSVRHTTNGPAANRHVLSSSTGQALLIRLLNGQDLFPSQHTLPRSWPLHSTPSQSHTLLLHRPPAN